MAYWGRRPFRVWRRPSGLYRGRVPAALRDSGLWRGDRADRALARRMASRSLGAWLMRVLWLVVVCCVTLVVPSDGVLSPAGAGVAVFDAPLRSEAESAVARYRDPETGTLAHEEEMRRLEAVAGSVGARIEWGIAPMLEHCTSSGPRRRLHGAFCPRTPDVVYINPYATSFSSDLRNGSTASTLRHELAHRAMLLACGTVSPRAANGRDEAVASAYAIRYYGADHDSLTRGHGAEYQVRDGDYEAAALIHAGFCG